MPRAQPGEENILQKPFLKAYAEIGKISVAAETVGMNRVNHFHWMKQPAYRERFNALSAEWKSGGEKRKDEVLKRISKTCSLELLEDLEKLLRELLRDYSYGPKRKIKRRASSGRKTRKGLLDQIARHGVFGVKYKDFDSAPEAAQRVIEAVAAAGS